MKLAWTLLVASSALAMDTVWVDTDCGYFGDDGSALVMLARSPNQLRIEGVSIVTGNVWAAASVGYVREILALLGRADVRPAVGAQLPFTHSAAATKREAALEFAGAFGEPMKLAAPTELGGVEAMARAIRRAPGAVTLLALGPMTNVAMLLRLDPGLETKIRRIVFMGGNVHVPGNASPAAEFNFWFDPEAAQAVLRSKIPEKVMFPLDICNQAVLTRDRYERIAKLNTPVTRRYREDYGNRYPGFIKNPNSTGYLWDELAAAWLIDPAFVKKTETLYLDTDTRFGKTYGATIALDRALAPEATPVQVMLTADVDRLFDLYTRLLSR